MIPDYMTMMLPILDYLSSRETGRTPEIIQMIADRFNLTDEERTKMQPSGINVLYVNRTGWAIFYLKKAGLISLVQRGTYKITKDGKSLLAKGKPVTSDTLREYPSFLEFVDSSKKGHSEIIEKSTEVPSSQMTPDEMIEKGFSQLNAALASNLLAAIMDNKPGFFEKLVKDLLDAMDYGETTVTGGSGDGGIDGYVDQDELGLDKIFFQAKRYSGNVPSTALRDFMGALDSKGVARGVFITTSDFPSDYQKTIGRSQKSIVLINGTRLTELMIKYNIGVTRDKAYERKRVDYDYFSNEI